MTPVVLTQFYEAMRVFVSPKKKKLIYHFKTEDKIEVKPLESYGFPNVFPTVLELKCVSCIAAYRGVRKFSDFIKKILICVLKMNKGITGFGTT